MNNGKQSEQLLKVLGGHSASLDRTSKCRGLSEQPLYSGGHKAMQHETRNTILQQLIHLNDTIFCIFDMEILAVRVMFSFLMCAY